MAKQIPRQLIESLKGVPGFEAATFEAVHLSGEQVTSIRYNPPKISEQFIDEHLFPLKNQSAINDSPRNEAPKVAGLVPWCNTGRYLSERPSFTLDPVFHAGAYYVQEASSMFLDHIIKTMYGESEQPARVLDLCAAPGGKSTLLAARLPGSFFVSNEVIKNRVTILAENISKWGSSNVAVTHNDPADFKKLPGYFDLIVVDAPCSGSGLFRKDEKAIDEWSEANVSHCSLRQQRILADVIPSLNAGGYLVYSTCSYSPKEDEEICDWLVSECHLTPVTIKTDPSWGIIETTSTLNKAPGYRFYPDKLKGEGFFIACFQQQNEVEELEQRSEELPFATKNEAALINDWLLDPFSLYLFKQKETFIGFHKKWLNEFSTVQKKLHVRKSGVALGTIKGKDFIPHHELALSSFLNPTVPFVELDENQILRYLKRQDFLPGTNQRGWALARFNNLNFGWMKLLGNRVNNYYPTEWRILKP